MFSPTAAAVSVSKLSAVGRASACIQHRSVGGGCLEPWLERIWKSRSGSAGGSPACQAPIRVTVPRTAFTVAPTCFFFLIIFFKFYLFMIVIQRERERGRDTGRGRSRLHAPGA